MFLVKPFDTNRPIPMVNRRGEMTTHGPNYYPVTKGKFRFFIFPDSIVYVNYGSLFEVTHTL